MFRATAQSASFLPKSFRRTAAPYSARLAAILSRAARSQGRSGGRPPALGDRPTTWLAPPLARLVGQGARATAVAGLAGGGIGVRMYSLTWDRVSGGVDDNFGARVARGSRAP